MTVTLQRPSFGDHPFSAPRQRTTVLLPLRNVHAAGLSRSQALARLIRRMPWSGEICRLPLLISLLVTAAVKQAPLGRAIGAVLYPHPQTLAHGTGARDNAKTKGKWVQSLQLPVDGPVSRAGRFGARRRAPPSPAKRLASRHPPPRPTTARARSKPFGCDPIWTGGGWGEPLCRHQPTRGPVKAACWLPQPRRVPSYSLSPFFVFARGRTAEGALWGGLAAGAAQQLS